MLQTSRIPFVLGCAAALVSLSACGGGQNPDGAPAAGAATPGSGGSGTAGNVSTAGGNASSGVAGTASGVAGTASGIAGTASGIAGTASGIAGTASGVAGTSAATGGVGGSSSTGGSGGASSEHFSFFLTSVKALVTLSGNNAGFGGDLRFGETGNGAGLRGADKICKTIAETSMPGNGKTWRAFLSATQGEQGGVVNAIDRVGAGPWYDRLGRLVAKDKADLGQVRPLGADPAILNDLPNEDGVPNHDPDGTGDVDNHDTLTGSGTTGQLFDTNAACTCNDWTSAESSGAPRVGHSWPRTGGGMGGPTGSGGRGGIGGPGGSGENWMSALTESGCAPGIFLIEAGGPGKNGTKSVGDGGGYGGFYCFALTP